MKVARSTNEVISINTLRPRQNGRRFADDIFKCIFLNENEWISLKISLKFVPKGPINNNPALVQIMAWRRSGDKPLSEPMAVNLLTHICLNELRTIILRSVISFRWGTADVLLIPWRWVGTRLQVTKPISSIPLFIFLALSKHTLATQYHVYIGQVSPQLSCCGTCQI